MMITTWRDQNYIGISLLDVSTNVLDIYVPDDLDKESLLDIFSKRISDNDAIKIIKELKAERDLISFGLSLNGEGLTSDRITEIDRIISKLSERFINS